MNGEVIFDLHRRTGKGVVKDADHIGIFRISVQGFAQHIARRKEIVERPGLMTSGDQNVVTATTFKVIESDVIAAAANQYIVTGAGAQVIATMAAFKHIALAAASDHVVTRAALNVIVARIIAMQFPVTEIAMTVREAIITQGGSRHTRSAGDNCCPGRCARGAVVVNCDVIAVIVSYDVFAVVVNYGIAAMCAHDVSLLRV